MLSQISYRGGKLPIRVGYKCIKMVKLETKKDITELEDDDFDVYEVMLYYALMQGHKAEGREFTIKREDVEDILDECYVEFVKAVMDFAAEVKAVVGEGDPSKKKK